MRAVELKPITPTSAALALLCAALWGGTAAAVRYTQDVMPPLATAGFRFGLASLVIAGWCWYEGAPLAIRRGQWGAVVGVGLLLFLQIGLFHAGLTRTSSAHGSVLIGSNSVFIALLAHFLLPGDRLTWSKSLGLIFATAGLVTVFAGKLWSPHQSHPEHADTVTLLGDLMLLTSSVVLASKTVYTKNWLDRIEPATLILYSGLLASGLFLLTSAAVEGVDNYRLNAQATAGLAYQSFVVAGFCFVCYTTLLRRHRASEIAVFTFLQPLFGIVIGWLMRGDHLTPWLLVGGLAVAIGVLLVTRGSAKTVRVVPDEVKT